MAVGSKVAPGSEAGLLATLRRFAMNLVTVAETRVEIFSTEFQEEVQRAERLVAVGVAFAFCTGMALVLLSVFLVVLFWETHRLAVLGLLAGLFAGGALALGLLMRALTADRSKPFETTLAELGKDRERLGRGGQ